MKLRKKASLGGMSVSLLLAVALQQSCSGARMPEIKHVNVAKELGRFAGWPANHGMWSWGNEILVGFEIGYLKISDKGHAIDYDKPAEHLLARSLDGGETWKLEKPRAFIPPPGARVAGVPAEPGGKEPVDCPGGIDFTHPDFAVTLRMLSFDVGPSRFLYSTDRGRSWEGPFNIPSFGQKGIAARTDYIVNSKHDCMIFVTAAKPDAKEGRVMCARTRDGGANWEFVSWVTPESEGYSIMPSTVRISASHLVSTVRRKEGQDFFIEAYVSNDNARSWSLLSTVTPHPISRAGNPPSLIALRDGRLCVTYGWRAEPYGIRARLSNDNGKSWGKEIILRDDGGSWDLGYPLSVQREDGKIVTVYYFNEHPEKERYIVATIWDPDRQIE